MRALATRIRTIIIHTTFLITCKVHDGDVLESDDEDHDGNLEDGDGAAVDDDDKDDDDDGNDDDDVEEDNNNDDKGDGERKGGDGVFKGAKC